MWVIWRSIRNSMTSSPTASFIASFECIKRSGGWITPLLFGVSRRDPSVYIAVMLTLLAVGVLASAVPASKAARVDPSRAFRTE